LGDQGGKLLGAAEITLRERLLCLLQCRNRGWRCGPAAQHQPGRNQNQPGAIPMRETGSPLAPIAGISSRRSSSRRPASRFITDRIPPRGVHFSTITVFELDS
jgi:hypothetical protein